MEKKKQIRWKHWLAIAGGLSLGLGVLTLILGGTYIGVVQHRIRTRIEQLGSTRSSQFFGLYLPFQVEQRYRRQPLESLLKQIGYKRYASPSRLRPKSYVWQSFPTSSRAHLIIYRPRFLGRGKSFEAQLARITFKKEPPYLVVQKIVRLDTREEVEAFDHPPKEIGYYYAGRLRTQHAVPLSQIPVELRLAIIAIEDNEFLKHHGVSIRGTIRALWKDVIAMKWVQGGSTITQQLMKNLFFSNQKVLSRKFKEAFYAFVAEALHEKEAILEAYLNEVYLGQRGAQEIHGVSEAARYFFNRSVFDLSLAQSATLAGMNQRPNYYDPRRHPERTQKRRNLVLQKMRDYGYILPAEYRAATREPLGVASESQTLDNAGYFMDLVMKQIPKGLKAQLDTGALTLYLTIDPYLQNVASQTLLDHIKRMENYYKTLKDNRKAGALLQGALIALDLKSCSVLALQGGRSFKQTQFNRILQGKRQPGSLFKPFVYLTALDQKPDEGEPITPITEIDDAPFEWQYEGQTWSPKNYDEKFRGPVTVRHALQNSINVPTAKIAERVGVQNIVETLFRAGIQSALPPVPSISLGSAEVSPFEVAQAFGTVGRIGNFCPIQSLESAYDENGNVLLENTPQEKPEQLPPPATFQTVQLMKGVISDGTAKWAQKSGIDLEHVAGKTGTTNDFRDAWFVGFSPRFLTLVWIGYDEKDKVGLSGAAAALPIWVDFVKQAEFFMGTEDFEMPSGLTRLELDRQTRKVATRHCPSTYWEFFRLGTEPLGDCPLHR